MKRFYACLISLAEYLQSPFLLLVRLFWGYQFFQTGLGKLHHIDSIASYFASLHIPLPLFNAYLVGTIECVGGLCLLVGLASRLVALPLICILITALLTADREAVMTVLSNSKALLSAAPFTFLLAVLLIFIFGPGCYSLDGLIKRYGMKK